MTQTELTARAIQRAHDEHVHIFSVPGREGVYTTCSKSEPGKKYTLVNRTGEQACTCRGFEHRRSCKHVEALRNRLARESRRAAEHPRLRALRGAGCAPEPAGQHPAR